MKMAKHSIKTLAPQCAMPSAGKKEKKRNYTKQRVMPITEESDSLTQSLTQHTGG